MLNRLTTIVKAPIVDSASTKYLIIDQIVCSLLGRRWPAKLLEILVAQLKLATAYRTLLVFTYIVFQYVINHAVIRTKISFLG